MVKENEFEPLEMELNSKQCAEVALYMYNEWQRAMKPPLYRFLDFGDWLMSIIERETQENDE